MSMTGYRNPKVSGETFHKNSSSLLTTDMTTNLAVMSLSGTAKISQKKFVGVRLATELELNITTERDFQESATTEL